MQKTITEMRESGIQELAKLEGDLSIATNEFEAIREEKKNTYTALDKLEAQHTRFYKEHTSFEQSLKAAEEREIKPLKDWENELAKCSTALASCVSKIEKYDNLLTKYSWWNRVFGANGLKAHIFGTMLHLINEAAVKYADVHGLGVKFWVDTEKASTPFMTTCYIDGIYVAYEELSGGQQQRIDLCLAFALHDVLSKATDINLLVFDEAFEGLDDAGLATCYSFISAKAKEKKVFIISHMNSSSALNAKTIEVTTNDKKHTIYG
jgi:DNA repair exonuclease SbcCD ATPase subunit